MHLARRPPPPLGDVVDVIWLWEGEPEPSHRMERVLPDGSMGIVVNLHEDRIPLYDRRDPRRFETTSGSLLVAEQSRFDIIDAVQPAIVGVAVPSRRRVPVLQGAVRRAPRPAGAAR
jgi:hypothetical protein